MTSARGEKPEEEEGVVAGNPPTIEKTASAKEDAEIVDIEELLFKQNHIDFNFESTEIFLEPKISYGLYSFVHTEPF